MVGAQRAGEAGEHVGAVRCRDECLQRRRRHDVGQRAALLVGGVEHQPGKAGIACMLDEIEIDAAIGQQHADEQHARRDRARARRSASSAAPRLDAETDLDDVGAGSRHGDDGARRGVRVIVGSPMVALTGMWRGTRARMALTVACGSAPSAPAAGFFASMMSAARWAHSSASVSFVTLASSLAVRRTIFHCSY